MATQADLNADQQPDAGSFDFSSKYATPKKENETSTPVDEKKQSEIRAMLDNKLGKMNVDVEKPYTAGGGTGLRPSTLEDSATPIKLDAGAVLKSEVEKKQTFPHPDGDNQIPKNADFDWGPLLGAVGGGALAVGKALAQGTQNAAYGNTGNKEETQQQEEARKMHEKDIMAKQAEMQAKYQQAGIQGTRETEKQIELLRQQSPERMAQIAQMGGMMPSMTDYNTGLAAGGGVGPVKSAVSAVLKPKGQ